MRVEFDATLWRWEARVDDWYFVSLPEPLTPEIAELKAAVAGRGFGSVRVSVQLGSSTWRTSIFPDAAQGAYVLPIKRAVREAEEISEGDSCRVTLEIET